MKSLSRTATSCRWKDCRLSIAIPESSKEPSSVHSSGGTTTALPTSDIIELATFLALALARCHAFTDGNKRTAVVLMGHFIDWNGFQPTTANNDDSIGHYLEATVMAYQESEQAGDAQLARFTGYLRTVTRPC
jgi:prophage maintenance system killer protein